MRTFHPLTRRALAGCTLALAAGLATAADSWRA